MASTGAISSVRHGLNLRQALAFGLLAASATATCYVFFNLAASFSIDPRRFHGLLVAGGVTANDFAAGALFARLTSRTRRQYLALGCTFGIGSLLQALVCTIVWVGARGPFVVFIGVALAILIAWSVAGAVYLFIGDDDGLTAFFVAGAGNASMLLLGRIAASSLDHAAATDLMSVIFVSMFVVSGAWIGALLPPPFLSGNSHEV